MEFRVNDSNISVWGFDIANYGDLLFPLLAEKRLSPLGIKIVAVSPVGSEPVWEDCLPSVGIDKIVNVSGKPSAVLIGGGNILTLSPTKLPAYNQGSVPILAYPDIWIGASCFANEKVRRDRAVGVLPAEPQEGYREIICT